MKNKIYHNSINIEIYCTKYWPILQFSQEICFEDISIPFSVVTTTASAIKMLTHIVVRCVSHTPVTVTFRVLFVSWTPKAHLFWFGIYCMWRHLVWRKHVQKHIEMACLIWLFFFLLFCLLALSFSYICIPEGSSFLKPHSCSFRSKYALHFSIQFNKNLYLYFVGHKVYKSIELVGMQRKREKERVCEWKMSNCGNLDAWTPRQQLKCKFL